MQELLKHFHELSLHPKNAKELKGLVLQLAIQGKLTANWRIQNPELISGDNSAQSLLEKIKAEKEKLIEEKKIKKSKSLPVINEQTIPFKLPGSWAWSYLDDLGFTNVGLTYKPSHKVDDGVPVLRSSNIQNGKLDFADLVRVKTNYRKKDIIENGDLLICARNGSKKLVGKCTIVEDLKEITVFGAFMAVFRSDFNDYIKLFIESPIYRNRLEGVSTTTINQITQGNLKSTFIPFPPVAEQKAIVKTVEKLFKEVEALESLSEKRIELKRDYATSALNHLAKNDSNKEWQALKPQFHTFFNEFDNIKKLRETILQLAVQGKLTAKWRTQNPELISGENSAENLLKKIKAEKAKLIKEKKIKKEKALPPITEDEIPYELPEGWVWSRIGHYSHYGSLGKYENKDAVEDTWVLELEDVEKDSSKLLKKVRFKERKFKSTKSVFKRNDIIYGKLRPYLDKVVVADEDGVCTTEMIPIRSFVNCSSEYLRWYLKNPRFIEYANSSTHGMRMPRMGTDVAKNAIVSVPPAEEQKAIVKKVNTLMILCDQLEKEVGRGQQQIEDLMQSVLREVFEREKELEINIAI